MKKALVLIGALLFFCSVSSANNCESCKKMLSTSNCRCENEHQNENEKENQNIEQSIPKKEKRTCQNCEIEEDDEYFTYNQCYFDKEFRKMKRMLCLTQRQEKCIDKIYLNFKTDIEKLHENFKNKREKLICAYENNCKSQKELKNELKEHKSEAKEKYKVFNDDIKEHLCKKQLKDFKKFQKEEKRKFNKLKKYCVVYKFPCSNCDN